MQNRLWLDNIEIPQFEQLKSDIKTDVLVIGGGISGILTAYFLNKKGIKCIVAEKDRILNGVTSGTTGKITAQHGLIYQKIFKTFGGEYTKQYLESQLWAVDFYKELAKNIDCDFEIKENFVYSLNNYKLSKEVNVLAKLGYTAEYCDIKKIPVASFGAVKFKEQAQFHPIKFLKEIAKDLNIYEKTFVKEINESYAITDFGKIKAEHIVIATHFPFLDKHGNYFLKLYQHRSYAIAIDNAPDYNGMYVSDVKNGLSFRNYGNLLLIIGGSHRTGKYGGGFNEIEQFARIHFPQSNIKYRWATQDCMSLDSMPYIGEYSKNTSKLYTLSGFNKWGMTSALLGAKIISDKISGEENDYYNIYSPDRSILKPQLLVNGFESAVNLITPFGKRCTHLGCKLKWNSMERTWDCPCHGSRFDTDGRIIDNPANKDLKI